MSYTHKNGCTLTFIVENYLPQRCRIIQQRLQKGSYLPGRKEFYSSLFFLLNNFFPPSSLSFWVFVPLWPWQTAKKEVTARIMRPFQRPFDPLALKVKPWEEVTSKKAHTILMIH